MTSMFWRNLVVDRVRMAAVLGALLSCGGSDHNEETSEKAAPTADLTLALPATFRGELPCADCPEFD